MQCVKEIRPDLPTFHFQAWLGLLLLVCCGGCGSGYNATIPSPSPPFPTSSGSLATLYTMSNAISGNTVVAYARNADGTLGQAASYATGGLGVGHGLENQGALTLSDDRKYLFVVNAGSDDVSVFEISSQGLTQTARASSGGRLPVSVAERAGLVYVLNRGSEAGDPRGDTISGLRLAPDGSLTPISESTRQLSSANTNPAQIAFSPNGDLILVTEHGAGLIDTYTVDSNGVAGGHKAQPSAGTGPFGFAFRNASQLFVSEAGGGTASSYAVDGQGVLQTISAAVQTQQATACWLVITQEKKEAYVSNTASGTISEFAIAADGSLSLIASVAASTQGPPLDMAITSDGLYLNVLTASGNIEVFRIDPATGGLTQAQILTGLPTGSNGLVSF
jgi:6-phosphogluconolactonase